MGHFGGQSVGIEATPSDDCSPLLPHNERSRATRVVVPQNVSSILYELLLFWADFCIVFSLLFYVFSLVCVSSFLGGQIFCWQVS